MALTWTCQDVYLDLEITRPRHGKAWKYLDMETTQRGELLNVDIIPSPYEEPTSPTSMEEET